MKMADAVKRVAYLATLVVVSGLVAWTFALSSIPIVLAIAAGVGVVAFLIARWLTKRVGRSTVLEIDLDGGLIEHTGSDPLSQARYRNAMTAREVVDALNRAADDPRVSGLVARIGNGKFGVAHAQEVRDAIASFRASGKKTIAFSESFGESGNGTIDYYVASAFDTIVLQPNATASVHGLVGRGRFVRGLLDKLGVFPDMDHRHEYKAAKYMLTETSFTDAHRESVHGITSEIFDQVVAGIARDRRLSEEDVRETINRSPFVAREVLDLGLVDRLSFRDEAYELAGDGPLLSIKAYLKKAGPPNRKGDRIGFIHGSGAIHRGSSSIDPFSGGPSMGADDVAKAFRAAAKDKKVKAIVFRVDSPGGSAVGSEVIGREVVRAQEAGKPVVVSMGNVAGSGGYWISAMAHKIVAQPGTITGSIGVVTGKLATREAWANAGITFDQIAYGDNSTYSSPHDPFTDTERERLQNMLDTIYDDFTALVSNGRNLEMSHVEEIAKGRVWTGTQAKDRGLVDELGGIATALELAKGAAGLDPDAPVSLVGFPKKERVFPPVKKENSEPINLVAEVISGVFDTLDPMGVQLRMPQITIR